MAALVVGCFIVRGARPMGSKEQDAISMDFPGPQGSAFLGMEWSVSKTLSTRIALYWLSDKTILWYFYPVFP